MVSLVFLPFSPSDAKCVLTWPCRVVDLAEDCSFTDDTSFLQDKIQADEGSLISEAERIVLMRKNMEKLEQSLIMTKIVDDFVRW